MAKTYNGRFNLPKKPESGNGWLVLGVILIVFGSFPGIVLGGLSLWKYSKCRKECRLYERFLECCAVIGMRSKISIREFAKASGKSITDQRAELQSMIAKGYFGDSAYLDVEGGNLVIPVGRKSAVQNWKDVVLDLIHSLQRDFDLNGEAADAQYQKEEVQPEPQKEPEKDVKRTYMDELERTLNELYQLNTQIEDEGVSRRIDRIGELTGGIFRAVIENPARESDVRKFMNYYLPTTLKLLKSYDLMENQSYQGENILASRKKIENVLDMLIEAYEKLLDKLFGDDALDIATDIDVLETMMAGDGLSSKGTLRL